MKFLGNEEKYPIPWLAFRFIAKVGKDKGVLIWTFNAF